MSFRLRERPAEMFVGLTTFAVGVWGVYLALTGDLTEDVPYANSVNEAAQNFTGLVGIGLIVISLMGMTRGFTTPISVAPDHSLKV
ncbi:MAG: hypothetical protein AAB439_00355 [Patescibacteria group bacterium]